MEKIPSRRHGTVRFFLRVVALASGGHRCVQVVGGQRGIASLNDPCDCMQNHDYWVSVRAQFLEVFVPDYHVQVLDPTSRTHYWVLAQTCIYSPENEESHRPAAVSDCIPGFLLLQVVCAQRHLLHWELKRALDFVQDMMRLLAFGERCLRHRIRGDDDKSKASSWPGISEELLIDNYVRMHRAWLAGRSGLLDVAVVRREMIWRTEVVREEKDGAPLLEMEPFQSRSAANIADAATGWEKTVTELLEESDEELRQRRLAFFPKLLSSSSSSVPGRPLPSPPLAATNTCPKPAMADGGACWILSPQGASCAEACVRLSPGRKVLPPPPPGVPGRCPQRGGWLCWYWRDGAWQWSPEEFSSQTRSSSAEEDLTPRCLALLELEQRNADDAMEVPGGSTKREPPWRRHLVEMMTDADTELTWLQQEPWAVFECLVPNENRYHPAHLWEGLGWKSPADWRYPVCRLACPCEQGS